MSETTADQARAGARHELAVATVRELGLTMPAGLPVAMAIALVLRHRLPTAHLVLWVLLVTLDVCRAMARRRYDLRELAAGGSVERWSRRTVPHCLWFGLTWGVLPVLAYVDHDAGAMNIAIVVSLAITAVSVGSLAFRLHYVVTLLGITVPTLGSAIAFGGDQRLMGLLGVVYDALVIAIHGRLSAVRHEAVELKHVNASLAGQLALEHGRVRRTNERLAEANELLTHRAQHDPLTGLPNRALALDTLTDAVQSAAPGASVAVLYCDLDGFKPVNDTHGHHAGDHLLVAVAKRLRGAVGGADLVARLGGDEFVVVARGVDSAEQAMAIAERLRDAVSRPFALEGQAVAVGISIGVVVADRFCTATELLRLADEALYRVKRSGRGTITVVGLPEPAAAADLRRR